MREILFRGQTRRKGEKVNIIGKPLDGKWVYGGVFTGEGDFSIIYTRDPIRKYSVYSDTVGQYTGLTDKNGKKIFEGDIIHYLYTPGEGFWNADEICEVKFEGTGFYIECIHNNQFARHSGWLIQIPYGKDKSGNVCEFEVIGNIHDNPELLGGINNEKNN